jgi:two-component system chemotaxis response regulator CheB
MRKKSLSVLIVDDSAFSRQTIKGILQKDPDVGNLDIAFDGKDGLNKILKKRPDIVTLDLEMPGMDGFTLLRWIMEKCPLPVIVISAHGGNNTVFKALQLGAADFIVKPTKRAHEELKMIEEDLLRKFAAIKALRMDNLMRTLSLIEEKEVIKKVRYVTRRRIEVITMGASTGGPTAIQSILSRLPSDLPASILISQHMPEGFTRYFAERMNSVSLLRVREARDGQPIRKGEVLVCPGGHHLFLRKSSDNVYVRVKKASPHDRYVPSIDMMMHSASDIYGDKVMGIILTGMGRDGVAGMKQIKDKNGLTVVESEKSAVVYGMANEAISAGVVEKVLPLKEIPSEIIKNTSSSS